MDLRRRLWGDSRGHRAQRVRHVLDSRARFALGTDTDRVRHMGVAGRRGDATRNLYRLPLMRGSESRALRGASTVALAAHAALIVFSTAAMLTILSGPASPALQREPAATIMRVAWKY